VKQFLRRYRWWLLLLVVIAGLASWSLWPKSLMREHYERIRIGMTTAEVRVIMKTDHPLGTRDIMAMHVNDLEKVADEGPWPKGHLAGDEVDDWYDGSIWIQVFYRDGKAFHKRMIVHSMLQQFLYWLRGLVGL
jgi:hypothetical protein